MKTYIGICGKTKYSGGDQPFRDYISKLESEGIIGNAVTFVTQISGLDDNTIQKKFGDCDAVFHFFVSEWFTKRKLSPFNDLIRVARAEVLNKESLEEITLAVNGLLSNGVSCGINVYQIK